MTTFNDVLGLIYDDNFGNRYTDLPLSGEGDMSTFYIVVKSQDLMEIRKEVEKLYIKRAGQPGQFRAERFYPHITVDFNKRDQHESDGLIKDKTTCFKPIQIR